MHIFWQHRLILYLIPCHFHIIFIFWQGEQGLPGLGLPGLKGEKVSLQLLCASHGLIAMQTNPADSLPFPRASVACASRPRLAADPPASKCPREQEASQANRAFRVRPDLQVSELMANRLDCSVRKQAASTRIFESLINLNLSKSVQAAFWIRNLVYLRFFKSVWSVCTVALVAVKANQGELSKGLEKWLMLSSHSQHCMLQTQRNSQYELSDSFRLFRLPMMKAEGLSRLSWSVL